MRDSKIVIPIDTFSPLDTGTKKPNRATKGFRLFRATVNF